MHVGLNVESRSSEKNGTASTAANSVSSECILCAGVTTAECPVLPSRRRNSCTAFSSSSGTCVSIARIFSWWTVPLSLANASPSAGHTVSSHMQLVAWKALSTS